MKLHKEYYRLYFYKFSFCKVGDDNWLTSYSDQNSIIIPIGEAMIDDIQQYDKNCNN